MLFIQFHARLTIRAGKDHREIRQVKPLGTAT